MDKFKVGDHVKVLGTPKSLTGTVVEVKLPLRARYLIRYDAAVAQSENVKERLYYEDELQLSAPVSNS